MERAHPATHRTFENRGPHSHSCDVAFSPNNKLVATSSASFKLREMRRRPGVALWDAETWELRHQWEESSGRVEFHPQGKFFLLTLAEVKS